MIAAFASFLAGSNLQYTLIDVMSPVIGISFTLILLRLNINKRGSNTSNTDMTGPTYPIRTISIAVAKHVDVDSDLENRCPGKGCSCHTM